jgi:hypothetical protein
MRPASSTRRAGGSSSHGSQVAGRSADREASTTPHKLAPQPKHSAPSPQVRRPAEASDSEGEEGEERAGSRGIFGFEEPAGSGLQPGEEGENHEPLGLAAAGGLTDTQRTAGKGAGTGTTNTKLGGYRGDIDDVSDQHARGITAQLERMAAAGEVGVTTAAKGTKKGASSLAPSGPQILVFSDRKAPTAGPLKSSPAACVSSTSTFQKGPPAKQAQGPVFTSSSGPAGTKGKPGAAAPTPVREPSKEELARMQAAWDAL